MMNKYFVIPVTSEDILQEKDISGYMLMKIILSTHALQIRPRAVRFINKSKIPTFAVLHRYGAYLQCLFIFSYAPVNPAICRASGKLVVKTHWAVVEELIRENKALIERSFPKKDKFVTF